jgi:ATP-dependent helicase HrpB
LRVVSHLPIEPFLDRIVADVRRCRAAVITAAPGAGKTTRVPPALVSDGPVILLQPRRVAARAIASRIAAERGWTLGREVGWQIRFDKRFSSTTQLLVVTEGILTARMQTDPLLSDFRTVVLDEFHERSIHADLAIALARQAWRARDDLRLVVMSATLDAASVSAFLDGCPIVDVPGRLHPITIEYAPRESVADAAAYALSQTDGQVLCFLPGAPEIQRAIHHLQQKLSGADVEVVPLHGSLDADTQDRALASSARRRIIVATNLAETSLTVPGVTAVIDSGLHKVARYDADRGIDSLETERITADAADQRAGRAGRLAPGLVRRLWDASDRLRPHREAEIHRVDLAAAALDVIAWGGDPRSLEWYERPREDALDAALALLERLGLVTLPRRMGPAEAGHYRGSGSPRAMDPAEARRPESSSLRHDESVVSGFSRTSATPPTDPTLLADPTQPALTALGERVRHIPLHPRLTRMLVEAGGAREIAQACALLSERHFLPPRIASTSSDLLSAIDDWQNMPVHLQRVANVIADLGLRIADSTLRIADCGLRNSSPKLPSADAKPQSGLRSRQSAIPSRSPQSTIRNPQSAMSDPAFRRAILAGYPDRVAQRRAPGSTSVRLASGTGAVISDESGVRDGEFLVALEVQAPVVRAAPARTSNVAPGRTRPSVPAASEARIRLASRVEREWLQPTATDVVHRFDQDTGSVKAVRVERYDALILSEHPVPVDADVAAHLLATAWIERGAGPDDERLLRRLRFAGRTIDVEAIVQIAARGARSLHDIHVDRGLPPDVRRALDRDAPETIAVPSGRHARLEYQDDGTVMASVKLQELFGLAETPRIGPRREPVLLSLLAPNGRPVQLTRDLRSFWDRTYPEVRKELRGRYPKHPWPEDPWNAPPTHRRKK